MQPDVCLFCDSPDKGYIPAPGNDFVCGSCVQILLASDRDAREVLHVNALNTGRPNIAKAISLFLKKRR